MSNQESRMLRLVIERRLKMLPNELHPAANAILEKLRSADEQRTRADELEAEARQTLNPMAGEYAKLVYGLELGDIVEFEQARIASDGIKWIHRRIVVEKFIFSMALHLMIQGTRVDKRGQRGELVLTFAPESDAIHYPLATSPAKVEANKE
jgi:hypothetical protein